MKKAIALALAVIIAFGWYVTLFGIGSVEPLKDQMKLGLDLKGGVYVVMEAETGETGEELKKLMDQTQLVIEKRVNEMGLSEPVVTIEGENRIRVELPGAENPQEVIDAVGKTAQLQFLLADGTLVLDGSMVKNATLGQDEFGKPAIDLTFTSEGAKAFEEGTKKAAVGVTSTIEGVGPNQMPIVLDEKILSSPNVKEKLTGGKAQITGSYSQDEARNQAMLIRGGALPVSLKEVSSSAVAATLGIDALKWSIVAGIIGVVLVFIVMILMYRIMGVAADIALLLYMLIVFWVMVSLGSVLTLPGIAGIILAIGMAVDANVIIFARIKEEIINGKSIRVAIDSGFKRAMATVVDSQITTIIAGVVLYQFGTGPVKGFAMTLMIGIVASVFTAVVVTNIYLKVIGDSKFFAKKKYFAVKEVK